MHGIWVDVGTLVDVDAWVDMGTLMDMHAWAAQVNIGVCVNTGVHVLGLHSWTCICVYMYVCGHVHVCVQEYNLFVFNQFFCFVCVCDFQAQQLMKICREYILGLSMEIQRKELPKV